jgi:hypothetical protein
MSDVIGNLGGGHFLVRERISNRRKGLFSFLHGDAMDKKPVPCCDMSDARWIICRLQVAGSQNIGGVEIGKDALGFYMVDARLRACMEKTSCDGETRGGDLAVNCRLQDWWPDTVACWDIVRCEKNAPSCRS